MKLKAGDRVWIGEAMGACRRGYARLDDKGHVRHPAFWGDGVELEYLGHVVEVNHDIVLGQGLQCSDYVYLIEALIGEGTIVVPSADGVEMGDE